MQIAQIVHESYRQARSALVFGTSLPALARARERAFIKALAAALYSALPAEDMQVFVAGDSRPESPFGARRRLHDIALCRMANTLPGTDDEMPYIRDILCQVELDFTREQRLALYAANRLRVSAAQEKLLVLALAASELPAQLAALQAPARCAAFCLATIPHPSDWEDTSEQPTLWRCPQQDWSEMR